MASNPKLKVETRTLFGRKTKQLRRQGTIPANVFGSGIESVAVQVKSTDFSKVYDEVGETGVVELALSGDQKTRPVLINGVQRDPSTEEFLHIDFMQVDLKKKITTTVPVETIGTSAAVEQGNVLVLTLNELEVEALPNDLPDSIEVDITSLAAVGDSLQVKDIKVSAGVTLVSDPDATIVTIQEPAAEEVEPEPSEAPDEAAEAEAEASTGADESTESAEAES